MKIKVPITKDPNDTSRPVPIRRGALTVAVLFAFVGIFSLGTYITWRMRQMENIAAVGAESMEAKDNAETYLKALSKIMWLPKEDKAPRVFQVTDPDILVEEQSFYDGVEVGDVLIVFDKSMKAILYSPRRGVIINTGPIAYRDTPLATSRSEADGNTSTNQ